jgi:two-component system sensor histidine kinase/response regulator
MEKLRLLVIDDEPGMRHSIGRALRSFTVKLPEIEGETGFDVDQAATVAEGLAQIMSAPPDILLLDYKLPDGTGLDVLTRLGDLQSRVLTVMVTAYATLDTAIRATKSGAHDFLAKPFTPTELKDTVRKAAEHLIVQRRARELAEEKRQVRFQFIRVLGHELKAPLAAVEGFLYLLRERTCGNDIAAYDEIVRRCLARTEGMRKLITDLLDLTRIESGERRRSLAEVDLVALAGTALETVQPAADERAIRLELTGDPDVTLHADRVELEIILNNLLSNAVKYNRDGGQVTLELRGAADHVTLAVTDTGIGLTPADCARLFNDFVRIKNDRTRMITGSGLGLSTVKKIAQLYDGDVDVHSTWEVGSTFTVTLKRLTDQPADDHAAQRDPTVVTGLG